MSVPCLQALALRHVSYLDITTASIEVQVKIFDLSVITKLVLQGFLVGLLVDICDNDDPSLD